MNNSREVEHVQTLVVGGGQAGLAVGYCLAQQGLPFLILDANERTGDAWRKRWDSLRLFTPASHSTLPGLPFPTPGWYFPSKDEVADYLDAYKERFGLPVRTGVAVDGLHKEGERFLVTAGGHRFEAENVVVATGAYQRPKVPDFATQLNPSIIQLHSSEYQRPSQLQEGKVLVVGFGNSGAEIALEVSRTHRTWLSGRYPGAEPARAGSVRDRLTLPLMWFLYSRVLNVQTPIGRKLRPKVLKISVPLARVRQKDIAAAGIERVPRTVGVQDGLPSLEDGQAMDVSNVIWCTGSQPDFRWIDLPVLDEDGIPMHERGVVASEAGLYFVGLFFQTAVTSGLVGGVGRDAAYVVRRIASRDAPGRPRRGTLSRG